MKKDICKYCLTSTMLCFFLIKINENNACSDALSDLIIILCATCKSLYGDEQSKPRKNNSCCQGPCKILCKPLLSILGHSCQNMRKIPLYDLHLLLTLALMRRLIRSLKIINRGMSFDIFELHWSMKYSLNLLIFSEISNILDHLSYIRKVLMMLIKNYEC